MTKPKILISPRLTNNFVEKLMKSVSRLPITLPDSVSTTETLRPAHPVNGPFSVTATFETIQDIIESQEGRYHFNYGYYRFIDSPLLYQIQEGLKAFFQLRNCWVYTSYKTAALELLDYLLLAKPQMTIKIIHDLPHDSHVELGPSLSVLNTTVLSALPEEQDTILPFSKERDELLVINVQDPLAFLEKQADLLQQAKSSRVPIIVASRFLTQLPETRLVNYWVFPLNEEKQGVMGGTIVSKVDRQMAELFELRKQRGPILSSRNAAYFLGQIEFVADDAPKHLVEKLCQLEKAKHGFLFPSGMQAITTLFNLLRKTEKAQMIVVGHLYTDTYSLLTYGKQRTGKVENIFLGVHELDLLPQVINDQTAAIITETITNPLNDVPDIEAITRVAKEHQIPVIVDNTFATPMLCNPLDLGADFVVHSTTKYFNGKNDHSGGGILLNDDEMAGQIQSYQRHWENIMSPLEASVLWERMQDFEERMARFQANALQVAEFLENHPAVDEFFSHQSPQHQSFEVSKRVVRGVCSVMSFTLKKTGLEGLKPFYDSPLEHILKAPSLGSDQTILCPYTMLAHYHESDEILEELHLSRYLVRISIGCETDIQPVLESLDQALQQTLI